MDIQMCRRRAINATCVSLQPVAPMHAGKGRLGQFVERRQELRQQALVAHAGGFALGFAVRRRPRRDRSAQKASPDADRTTTRTAGRAWNSSRASINSATEVASSAFWRSGHEIEGDEADRLVDFGKQGAVHDRPSRKDGGRALRRECSFCAAGDIPAGYNRRIDPSTVAFHLCMQPDYIEHGLLNLVQSLSRACGGPARYAELAALPAAALAEAHYVVFILADGLGQALFRHPAAGRGPAPRLARRELGLPIHHRSDGSRARDDRAWRPRHTELTGWHVRCCQRRSAPWRSCR